MSINIRRLKSIEEYSAAEELLQVCWNAGPLEAIPSHLMLTIQSESGLVLGAFTSEDRLIGFVIGFLSQENGTLKHHSHMTGVHPDFRNQNIAYQLKAAQREFIIEQGLSLCTWTFDPLECANATLNIAKLGAIAQIYKRDLYGHRLGNINAQLPTDRIVARWEVLSSRVENCIKSGQRVNAPIAYNAANSVSIREGVPEISEIQVDIDDEVIGLRVPSRFQRVKQSSLPAALRWRSETRTFFETLFSKGYSLVNITPDHELPDLLAFYTFSNRATTPSIVN